jgi:hypothetical protein
LLSKPVENLFQEIIVVVVSTVEEMTEVEKKEAIEGMEIVVEDQVEILMEETNGNVRIYLKKSLPLPGFKMKVISYPFKANKKEVYVTA